MANIKIKSSSVAGKVPLVGDLAYGELALNYADGLLFFKNSANQVTALNSSTNISSTDISHWNSAYSWGNHATAGYLTGITGTQVTNALGYTPYSSTNPSGYITSSALSSYLPLTGGNLTGSVLTETAASSWGVYSKTAGYSNQSGIWFSSNVGELLLRNAAGSITTRIAADGSFAYINNSTILLASNYSSYALPLTGGTITGNLTLATSGTLPSINLQSTGVASSINWQISSGIAGLANGGFSIRDTTVSANRFYIDSSGDTYSAVSSRSPTFYDSGNTAYYLNPNATSFLYAIATNSGITSGGNAGFYNDSYYSGVRNPIWSFGNASSYGISYFQGTAGIGGSDTIGIHPNGTATASGATLAIVYGYTQSLGSMRAPLFYDSDNTGYYVDPASTTVLNVLNAVTKSFLIDHPTKSGKKLRYACLEGPENGVYVRGKLTKENTIELPEYWTKLVDPDSITVSLTPIGGKQRLSVLDVGNNCVVIQEETGGEINCFYVVYGERVDVDKLEVEI